MENNFFYQYRGAIIGIIIAILFLVFELYKVILGICIIVVGALLGNYIQNNKPVIKEKLKSFIDKM